MPFIAEWMSDEGLASDCAQANFRWRSASLQERPRPLHALNYWIAQTAETSSKEKLSDTST